MEKRLAKDLDQAESIAQQKADDLIKHLAQPDFRARRVFELTRNPLLLTNICLVHWKQRGELPKRRVPLYEECIKVMLEFWRDVPDLKNMVGEKKGILLLQAVAFWLHQEEGRTRAAASDLISGIKPVLKKLQWTEDDTQKFLRIIRDESGLLTGWDEENLGFMHLNFQEYLVAREIRSRFLQEKKKTGKSEMLKELAKHFGKSWWQEVALLLLGIEEQPSLFVPYMREVARNPAFVWDADLVKMCLDDAVKPSLIPFEELLELKEDKYRDQSYQLLTALRILMLQDEKARKSIMERFRNHPDKGIRQWIGYRIQFADQDVLRPEPSGYELVFIPGGVFMMGSKGSNDEQPVHKVTVPDCYMGRYPFTNEEYQRFLEANPGIREPRHWGERKYNRPWQPVVGVRWYDAKAFAEWARLQLPSEAQWEYACRAGTRTLFYSGDWESHIKRAGWDSNNSGDTLHPVGEKEPNAFGLYDMHGNVWEWCEDHYHDNYDKAPDDGSAWVDQDKGAERVLRGSSWTSDRRSCSSANRLREPPDFHIFSIGFRLARLPGQPGEQSRSGKSRQGDA